LLDLPLLLLNVHDLYFWASFLLLFVIHILLADIESKLRQIEEDPEGAGIAHLYSVTQKISSVANRAFEPLFERQVYRQLSLELFLIQLDYNCFSISSWVH
jgi:hypothetical protein